MEPIDKHGQINSKNTKNSKRLENLNDDEYSMYIVKNEISVNDSVYDHFKNEKPTIY